MSNEWRELAVFADRASAEVLAGLLRSESIDVRIVSDEPVPGLIRSITVSVPAGQWMRASQLYSHAPLSEDEWAAHYMDHAGDTPSDQEEGQKEKGEDE